MRQITHVLALLGLGWVGLVSATHAGTYSGLWVGQVTVNKVNEAQNNGQTPTAVKQEFTFRVIVHVDESGKAHLLKDVIQMWKDGTLNADGSLATPGRYVLLTDDTRVWQFKGATLRDGQSFGYRISSPAYDFSTATSGYDAASKGVYLGTLTSLPATLTCTLSLPKDHPTNPFLHKYHPDHNNLDDQFQTAVAEAYDITRTLTFTLTATAPAGGATPGWGESVIGGTYAETATGLHKNSIKASGTFRLTMAGKIADLNPQE